MDAYQTFNAQFPCGERQYLSMVRDEAEHIRADSLSDHGYTVSFASARRKAEDLILTWARDANSYDLSDLPRFVATHRRACIWAVLVGQQKPAVQN